MFKQSKYVIAITKNFHELYYIFTYPHLIYCIERWGADANLEQKQNHMKQFSKIKPTITDQLQLLTIN